MNSNRNNKSLKIKNMLAEAVDQRKTDNTIAKKGEKDKQ
jgi:hypothetical protein